MPVKSVAVNAVDAVIAVPTVPGTVCDVGLIAGGFAIANVMVAVAVWTPSVAVIVIVAVEVAEGVPEMTPVDGLRARSAGSVPPVTV